MPKIGSRIMTVVTKIVVRSWNAGSCREFEFRDGVGFLATKSVSAIVLESNQYLKRYRFRGLSQKSHSLEYFVDEFYNCFFRTSSST